MVNFTSFLSPPLSPYPPPSSTQSRKLLVQRLMRLCKERQKSNDSGDYTGIFGLFSTLIDNLKPGSVPKRLEAHRKVLVNRLKNVRDPLEAISKRGATGIAEAILVEMEDLVGEKVEDKSKEKEDDKLAKKGIDKSAKKDDDNKRANDKKKQNDKGRDRSPNRSNDRRDLSLDRQMDQPVGRQMESSFGRWLDMMKPMDPMMDPRLREGSFGLPMDRPFDMPMDRRMDMPMDRMMDMPMDRRMDMPMDRMMDVPMDRRMDMPMDRRMDMPMDRMMDMPMDRRMDLPLDRMMDMPMDRIMDRPMDMQGGPIVNRQMGMDPMMDRSMPNMMDGPSFPSAMPDFGVEADLRASNVGECLVTVEAILARPTHEVSSKKDFAM